MILRIFYFQVYIPICVGVYALFRFYQDVPLGVLPEIWHFKSTHVVIENRHPLLGSAVLLDLRLSLDILNELSLVMVVALG